MSKAGPAGANGPLERGASIDSIQSVDSVALERLQTTTTANCEMAILPLALLLELQPQYLRTEGDALTSVNHAGGYNVISDGSAVYDGRQCQIVNYIERKVELKSHTDYKDYRETILSKPILFITNAKKSDANEAKTFAFIVNTRHPKVKAQVEGGMNDVISSVMGENYQLQLNFQNVVKDYLGHQYQLVEDNLSFLYTFKADVFLDIFHLLGFSKKTCHINGTVLNLLCTAPAKKEKVRRFLYKMTNPLVRMRSSNDNRQLSSFSSFEMISEDPFGPPVSPVEGPAAPPNCEGPFGPPESPVEEPAVPPKSEDPSGPPELPVKEPAVPPKSEDPSGPPELPVKEPAVPPKSEDPSGPPELPVKEPAVPPKSEDPSGPPELPVKEPAAVPDP
uniref:Uncharacterized protein n=1 Tax=Leptobrachium leishanense TaxID=445787 RepID=A0A8C5QII9_9ANUR